MCPSPRQALGLLLPKRLVKRQLEEQLRKQSILGMFKTFEPGCHFTGVDRRTPPDLQITVPSSLTAPVPPRRAPCSDLWPVPSISCYTRKFRPLNSARSPEMREGKLFDSSAGTGMAASDPWTPGSGNLCPPGFELFSDYWPDFLLRGTQAPNLDLDIWGLTFHPALTTRGLRPRLISP